MLIYLLLSFIWWQFLSITVISSGYHRYFAHKSFVAPVWYEWYVLSLGTLTGGGPLLGWAGVHRIHHKFADTSKDPHSSKYHGLLPIMFSTFKVPPIERKYIKDLLQNPRVMLFFRYHRVIRLMQLLVALLVALTVNLAGSLIIFVSPMIYSYIGFGLINTFGHGINGPINSHLLNILAAGDGYHKNHHDDPASWKIGKNRYQLDPGAWFIKFIKV